MQTASKTHPGYNNPLMLEPIEVLKLTVRTENVLKGECIYYLGQLIEHSEVFILNTPNLGRKSLREIIDALQSRGLALSVGGNQRKALSDIARNATDEEIKARITQYYCIDNTADNDDELTIKVALRASDVKQIGQEKLVEALKGACKDAFGRAIDCLIEARDLTIDSLQIDQEIMNPNGVAHDEQLTRLKETQYGELQIVQIPVSLDGNLSSMLSQKFQSSVANQLGGVTLYPLLKPVIDGLKLESV